MDLRPLVLAALHPDRYVFSTDLAHDLGPPASAVIDEFKRLHDDGLVLLIGGATSYGAMLRPAAQ